MNKNALILFAAAALSLASCGRPDGPVADEVNNENDQVVVVTEDDTVIVNTDNTQGNQTVEVPAKPR